MDDSISRINLSVVIPTHNRRELLTKELETLGHQTYPANQFEVIVVDDGSTDHTSEHLRSLVTPYKLTIHQQAQSGVGKARNQGFALASGEIVLCIDDDIIPQPNLLEEHMAAHRADARAVVIGHLTPDFSVRRSGWTKWGEISMDKRFADLLANRRPVVGRDLYSGNFSARRSDLQIVGGFDETMPLVEDGDLGCRLEEIGVRMVYNPNADCIHCGEQTGQGWLKRCYQWGQMDVFLSQTKGNHYGLDLMLQTLHNTNSFIRWIVSTSLNHRSVTGLCISLMWHLANFGDRIGLFRFVNSFYSIIAFLLFWQGISDELGGNAALWREFDRFPSQMDHQQTDIATAD